MRDLSWDQLAETLIRFRPNWGDSDDAKKLAPCWSPVTYRDKTTRAAANVAEVSALVLDYDGDRTIDQCVQAWGNHDAVIHTSWSHEPKAHKLRVILPLAAPISSDVWSGVYRAAVRRDGGTADPVCSDPSRLYLLPAMGRHAIPWAQRFDGERLDLRPMVAEVEAARRDVEAARVKRRQEAAREARRFAEAGNMGEAVRRAFESDPGARERLGQRLGGRVLDRPAGAIVKGIRCPNCGRDSVWWLLSPDTFGGAACDHRRSCGWSGPIWKLAEVAA